MLVLFETPAGYAIFKLLDENKLEKTDNLYRDFETPEAANKILKLKHFQKFADTTEALEATTAAVEGKLSKTLKKTLKKHFGDLQDSLAVADAKLGSAIKEKLNLSCVSNTSIQELMRCIRSQMDSLLSGLPKREMTAMALGLAHSLSRYKLKFSPDKIDTMIVQAVGLLDELDKELNNYIMRVREWYGWHFPELGKIVTDNLAFVKTVNLIGTRDNTSATDLSEVLSEDIEEKVKEAAEISMGTEINDGDILNIKHLCDQVIEISQYRATLYEYLQARMMAMAPNLTVLVGELVGARLISSAGSLINLAKDPSSTLQIRGAEKALFRALKTKKDTPKYGLIYHAQLIGQASAKLKGKMSRMLANKASLATRLDALGEDDAGVKLGMEHRAKLELRLRMLEEGNVKRISGTGKAKAKFEKYHSKSEVMQYPAAADVVVGKKRTHDESKVLIEEIKTEDEEIPKKKKKKEKNEGEGGEQAEDKESEAVAGPAGGEKKKKKKKKAQEAGQDLVKEEVTEEVDTKEQKKKKKIKTEIDESMEVADQVTEEHSEESKEQKKKKKKKKSEASEDVEVKQEVDEDVPAPTSEKKKKKKKKSQSEDS
ncbi:nucleolar protein 58 [Microplitis mediator]|uniref:nucleolar protein 58 n=1 Tax=Microplitis mediator TaxID=375433 RepID=UPI0025528973|nr:nucleolar protein 58 [Microplitis mediator]